MNAREVIPAKQQYSGVAIHNVTRTCGILMQGWLGGNKVGRRTRKHKDTHEVLCLQQRTTVGPDESNINMKWAYEVRSMNRTQ